MNLVCVWGNEKHNFNMEQSIKGWQEDIGQSGISVRRHWRGQLSQSKGMKRREAGAISCVERDVVQKQASRIVGKAKGAFNKVSSAGEASQSEGKGVKSTQFKM